MANKEQELSNEGFKRAVLQAMRNKWSPAELVERMEKTWQAAYNEANPKARSWKGMQAHVELVVNLLVGKPSVMEIPQDNNAINNLIQQVMAAKMQDDSHRNQPITMQ